MTQTPALGAHAAMVDAALRRLAGERVLSRLWECDASLWAREPAAQQAIRDRLGWLQMPSAMQARTATLTRNAGELSEGRRHVLLLGMGGSGLFADVCSRLFKPAPGHPDLTVLDTTDPWAIQAAQQRHPLSRTAVIVSSKSGTTVEISALAAYFHEALASTGGEPGARCLAVTDAGSPLAQQAAAWGCRAITLDAQTGSDVGGRFSALTAFGLLPAAVLGVDLDQLLQRAREAMARMRPAAPEHDNPGLQLGAVLGAFGAAGRDKLTLCCAPGLESFGTWVEQLIAESLGKDGRGVVPVHGEPGRDPSGYGADRAFVALQWEGRPDQALDAHLAALTQAGHPVLTIRWRDAYDIGREVVTWEVATAIAGWLLGVNPFDEPNVTESKLRTRDLLTAHAAHGRLPVERVETSADGLPQFLTRARPHDYITVLSFLSRQPAVDDAVLALRGAIAQRRPNATLAQFGPRYLHSTGQLFKGGPNTGCFIVLTSDESLDLPVPGASYTFGVLKHAQALGDIQAMRQNERRVLHLRLRGDAAQELQRLARAVGT